MYPRELLLSETIIFCNPQVILTAQSYKINDVAEITNLPSGRGPRQEEHMSVEIMQENLLAF